MKAKTWRYNIALFSLVILPLLLTSCLADLLNKHFGYELPIYLSYYSDYGDAPSRKQIESGYALTEDDLAPITVTDNEFLGWYLDKTYTSPANIGMILYDSTTLYACWKYSNYDNNTPYLIQCYILAPSNGTTTFTLEPDAFFIFYKQYELESYVPYIGDGFEYLPSLDNMHYEQNYYFGSEYSNYFENVIVVDKYFYAKYTSLDDLQYYQQLIAYGSPTLNLYLNSSIQYGYSMSNFDLPPVILNMEGSSMNKIEENTFKNCSWLKEIYLPYSIIEIGKASFAGCLNLEYVHTQGLTSLQTIGEEAFNMCINLKEFQIPDSIQTLGGSASGYVFSGCSSLTSIKIPKNSSLTSIKSGTFMNCSNLTTVYIPKNIKNIGSIAFYGTNLTDVYYEGSESDRSNSTFQINDDRIKDSALVTWHYNAY